jgi:pyridoxal phosphate enzyme (YggS family)
VPADVPDVSRFEQIRTNLEAVRARVGRACERAGRDPGEVTLIVVTKTYPERDVRALSALGVRDVGENRDQEAAPKAAACADLGLRWHFIGRLQSNKCKSVGRYATLVHSVDRPSLVTALAKAGVAAGRRLDCLVQVSLDDAPGRGGAVPVDVAELADAIAASEQLRLRGLMAVAPLGADARTAFRPLPVLLEAIRRDHPDAEVLSAGMSGDLEAAIDCGATHLRVGSAVLGTRPPLR